MKKHIRLLVEILIVLILLGIGSSAIIFASHQGYDSGYHNGLSDGYKSGHTQGYSQGHTDGYSKGLSDGKDQNANAGYAQGYTDGQNAATNDLATMQDWVVNSCTKYSNGYYQVVMWSDSRSVIHYNCLVG